VLKGLLIFVGFGRGAAGSESFASGNKFFDAIRSIACDRQLGNYLEIAALPATFRGVSTAQP
jgi:hypothetical protein